MIVLISAGVVLQVVTGVAFIATNYVIMRNVQGVRKDMKGVVPGLLRKMAGFIESDEPRVDVWTDVNGKPVPSTKSPSNKV